MSPDHDPGGLAHVRETAASVTAACRTGIVGGDGRSWGLMADHEMRWFARDAVA